jgi:peptide/nickel transport system permease protein
MKPNTIAFLVRRTIGLTALLALAGAAAFLMIASMPGSYEQALRLEPHYSAGAAAAFEHRHGLDRSVGVRIAGWLAAASRGSLGTSIEYEAPVAPIVATRAARTLLLAGVATVGAWLVALPLGVAMAAGARGRWDRAGEAAVTVALALPEPVLVIGLTVAAAQSGVVPAGGMFSARADVPGASVLAMSLDVARHLLLPASALAIGLLPVLVRHVRNSLAGTLGSPFVLAARARGIPPARLLFRSTLRAAATPLISLAGLSVGSLFSASLLVEVITGWPGLGPLLVEAARSRDVPVVVGVALCSTACLAVGGFATDLALRWADPRIAMAAGQGVEG